MNTPTPNAPEEPMPHDLDTATPTGHEEIDEMLGGGLRRGQLTAVTGAVACGKTMFVLGIARHAAIRGGHPALFASVECGPDHLTEYIVCAEARVRFGRPTTQQITEEEIARARMLRDSIVTASLRLESVAGWPLERLARTTTKLANEHGLRLLVVDYVQLLGDDDRPRSQAIEEIAVGLKRLAQTANIAVVAVSTMRSRAAKANGLLHPAMFDLGDTEAFERAADHLIILHREDQADPQSPRAGEADLILAKNRSGPTGTVTVAFQPHYARFVDMVRS